MQRTMCNAAALAAVTTPAALTPARAAAQARRLSAQCRSAGGRLEDA